MVRHAAAVLQRTFPLGHKKECSVLHRPGENLEFESACAGKKQTDTIMRVSKVVADPKKLLVQFEVP